MLLNVVFKILNCDRGCSSGGEHISAYIGTIKSNVG